MSTKKYPDHIHEWMTIIEQNVVADNSKMVQYCDKLERYAEENNEGFLKGFSLFYRGFNRYLNAQLEQGMEELSSALNLLITSQAWGMAAHTYNSMGNIADFQGDISLAIDCYIKGLALAKEHNIPSMEYNVRTNIANVYIGLDAYEDAAAMLQECERLLESSLKEAMPKAPQLAATANITNCYIRMNETDKAKVSLERLKGMCEDDPSTTNQLLISVLETQLFHATGEIEKRDAAINRLKELELRSMDVYDALSELTQHAELLLEINKFDQFLELIDRIQTLAESPNIEKRILDLQLKYYTKVGNQQKLAEMAMKYYVAAEHREEERNKIVSHNIITRIRLDEEESRRKEVEISNLQLKQKSERDALTGMNNRYKLNELAELAFHRAYLNATPLTVEILDIDCYKEFNDTYGHQAGDDCLVRIAEAIRSLEEFTGVHTARYGGDEFVIIYEEYSRADVEKFAQRLKNKIQALNIEHKSSCVSNCITISQGLFQMTPVGSSKIWDYLYGADMALYHVKANGRNNFFVATEFESVRQSIQ